MEGIFETNDSFDFGKLILTKPTMISGGNYFIRCLVDNSPLYIQPPKCSTKQGILKAGRRLYTDLMFTNENEDFIRWMENLENHCQQYIFKNREKWFDGEMDLHDIENYFTSPLKIYKSGKYYISRVNIGVVLNRPTLKIYDENEKEVNLDTINDKTNVITILEIQGIKCSARSFQIELEVKQMMVLKQNNIFEKCIIAASKKTANESSVTANAPDIDTLAVDTSTVDTLAVDTSTVDTLTVEPSSQLTIPIDVGTSESNLVIIKEENDYDSTVNQETILVETANEESVDYATDAVAVVEDSPLILVNDGLEEVVFDLEELKHAESLQLKKRNDVYYEMYREARRKAKIAKDLALSSYLEAKRIKNMYMLDDINESDDSDLEIDDEDSLEN